ncbi:MAG TPA: UvrB/UvrC motif-containing protein [Spirochaetia bacterium]|nr:UvrB/UvrC motif-containing protein [Spirochaetia bacterium]
MDNHQCDGCGESLGKIRVYQTKGTEYSELWLCDRCAQSLGVEEAQPAFAPTIAEMLGSLVGGSGTRNCPVCGMKFRTIRQTGRVGCAECYRVFRPRIQHLLEQTGLTDAHAGRYPARLGSFKRLLLDRESLRERLHEALAEEDYEAAVILRDQMKAIEEKPDEDV